MSEIKTEVRREGEKPDGYDHSVVEHYAGIRYDPYSTNIRDHCPVGGARKEEVREVISTPSSAEPKGDAERGFDVEPIDDLLAQLEATEAEWAHLRALHGPFGKWDNLRKNLLSVAMLRAREGTPPANAKGGQWTDALADAAAHADAEYCAFVNKGVQEAAEYIAMDAQREGIWARINRGQALLRTVRFS